MLKALKFNDLSFKEREPKKWEFVGKKRNGCEMISIYYLAIVGQVCLCELSTLNSQVLNFLVNKSFLAFLVLKIFGSFTHFVNYSLNFLLVHPFHSLTI